MKHLWDGKIPGQSWATTWYRHKCKYKIWVLLQVYVFLCIHLSYFYICLDTKSYSILVAKSCIILRRSEAVAQRCSIKHAFLQAMHHLQENACAGVEVWRSKLKFEGLYKVSKKRLRLKWPPLKFTKFLRTPILLYT